MMMMKASSASTWPFQIAKSTAASAEANGQMEVGDGDVCS